MEFEENVMTDHQPTDQTALLAQISELQERLAALEMQSTPVAAAVAQRATEPTPIGRRALLRRVGTVAAGAAAASVAGGMLRPAAAGTGIGGTMQIGQSNISSTASTPQTLLKVTSLDSAAQGVLVVTDGATASLNQNAAVVGIGGSQVTIGVAGINTSNAGIGLLGRGNLSAMQLAANQTHIKLTDAAGLTGASSALPTAAAMLSRSSIPGQVVMDASSNLWLATSGGLRRLAGPESAGAFHAITPVRAYDSRIAPNTKLLALTSRVVGVTPSAVPTGARAIVATLTVTNTEGSGGFLTITAGNVGSTTASSINWFGPGQNIATTVVSNLDSSGQFKMWNNSGEATQFIVDITGYYM